MGDPIHVPLVILASLNLGLSPGPIATAVGTELKSEAPDTPHGLVSNLQPTPVSHTPVSSEPQTGVNVVGFVNDRSGLGEIARLLLESLDAASIPTAVVTVGRRTIRDRLTRTAR